MTVTTTMAATYFATHLSGARWLALAAGIKTAAITMAEKDIMAILQETEIDATDSDIVAAVCEQSLFLAENYAEIERYDDAVSKSVDGFGSETKARATRVTAISKRALQFLSRILNDGAVRLARG